MQLDRESSTQADHKTQEVMDLDVPFATNLVKKLKNVGRKMENQRAMPQKICKKITMQQKKICAYCGMTNVTGYKETKKFEGE